MQNTIKKNPFDIARERAFIQFNKNLFTGNFTKYTRIQNKQKLLKETIFKQPKTPNPLETTLTYPTLPPMGV